MPAIASHTRNRIYKTEDFLNILDGDNLPIMPLLHFPGDKPPHQCLYEFGRIRKLIHLFDGFGCGFAVRSEIINHFAPADIVQQILRIIICLKIPLLAFAVL
jgi:nitrogenase molybdenum-iron protein alpha/beta subunit